MIKKTVLIIVSLILFSGCQQVQIGFQKINEQNSIDYFTNIQNHNIRDTFMELSNSKDGYKYLKLNKILVDNKFYLMNKTYDSIFLEKYARNTANLSNINYSSVKNSYDAESDLVAMLFIEQAKASGNTVIIYKSYVAKQINSNLRQAFPNDKSSKIDFGNNPVLVEYNQDGRVISFMTRTWQSIDNFKTDNRIYTNIYFGFENIKWFENTFSTAYLKNATLSSYKIRGN